MRHLITFAILALSLVAYVVGLENSAAFLVLVAIILEVIFWKRVISSRRKQGLRD